MTRAIKGLLLSALVLPGLGQVFLLHYKRGVFLILMVLAASFCIAAAAAQQALTLLENIKTQGGGIDMSTIINMASQAETLSGGLVIKSCSLLILAVWIFAIFDAYRIGKKKDSESRERPPLS